ncbi:hypothetical protein OSTOST_24781 [Ostertagia ostertagi]
MDDCRNTVEAVVRGLEIARQMDQMDQDKENTQGSEVSCNGKELVTLLRGEIKKAIESIRGLGPKIKDDLEEARIAPKYRSVIDKSIEQQVKKACETLGTLESSAKSYLTFGKELMESLQKRGIETLEDWDDFLGVVDRDGSLLAEICSMLDTNVLQVRDVVGEIQKLQEKQAKDMMRNQDEMSDEDMDGMEINHKRRKAYELPNNDENRRLQMTTQVSERNHDPAPTGAAYGQHLRPHLDRWETAAEQTATGANYMEGFLKFLQASSCVDPGVFRGKPNENFKEFLRRFRRKYGPLGYGDRTLLEILEDDHLGEKAKNVFLAIHTREVRGRVRSGSKRIGKASFERLNCG